MAGWPDFGKKNSRTLRDFSRTFNTFSRPIPWYFATSC